MRHAPSDLLLGCLHDPQTIRRRPRLALLAASALLATPVLLDAGQSAAPAGIAAPSEGERQTIPALRIAVAPVIDGRLTDEIWSHAQAADHFRQRDPLEGEPATERTEVRILFDEEALYVGARMFDRESSAASARLSSRDARPDADYLTVLLDPRHDHRTGVQFTVTAAGVQGDSVISNDTFTDDSWDAVWSSAVAHDADGWSAELRIPFSQLRISGTAPAAWGLNVSRFIHRKNETAWLEFWPKNDSGLASRMMHLSGLEGVRPRRRLELAPYLAARQEFVEADAGDPFNDGSRLFGAIGVDVKASVPGGLLLDATINPDFGQAEVDPAVVNLTAYETFFQEKRRFFIDGAEIFNNFGHGGSNNFFGFNNSNPSLFYSRRIGRAPSVTADGDFVDAPRATTILGAAKLTGKTSNGWSLGLIEAVTARERARHVTGFVDGRTLVEPTANYLVGRVQREFARGGAGLLTTAVLRNLETPALADALTRRAFVVAGDAYYFLDEQKDWVLTGDAAVSHVSGSAAAIDASAAFVAALFPAAGRGAPHPRPRADVARRLQGPALPQSQQRRLARQRRAVGGQSRVRVERPRLPQPRRSRRRPQRAAVAQSDSQPHQPIARLVAGEGVDLELQPRRAQRHVDGLRQRCLLQLLARQQLLRPSVPRAAGRPDARRPGHREPARQLDQPQRQHRWAQACLVQRLGRPRLERTGRCLHQR